MVDKVLSEERNRIVGLSAVGLGQGLSNDLLDLVLTQIFDVGVLTAQKVF
jgi:hypothetical protein